jgi:hypothetical protein
MFRVSVDRHLLFIYAEGVPTIFYISQRKEVASHGEAKIINYSVLVYSLHFSVGP